MSEIDQLWDTYLRDRDEASKRRLLEHYYYYLVKLARYHKALRHDPRSTKELASYGFEGLRRAVHSFDPNKGVQFETYSARPILGSILDGIRKETKRAGLTLRYLKAKHPDRVEAARERLRTTSLHSVLSETDFDVPARAEADEAADDEFVQAATSILPHPHDYILRRYVFDGATMAKIGSELDYSESRVSQLFVKTLEMVRSSEEVSRLLQDAMGDEAFEKAKKDFGRKGRKVEYARYLRA
jgi:RNA polymerase sigma factor (sigma-70 family)